MKEPPVTTTRKRPPRKTRLIGMYVNLSLYVRITQAAKQERRSVSDYLRLMVERELEKKTA